MGLLGLVGGSNTLALATTLVPLLGRAYEKSHGDSWVYDKLPGKVKEKGTLDEFQDVLQTGKAFLAAVWAFTHK